MNSITIKDGARFSTRTTVLKDGQPIMFHHGWPLSSDDWDTKCCSSAQRLSRCRA